MDLLVVVFLPVNTPPLYLPRLREPMKQHLDLRDLHPDRDDLSLVNHPGRFDPVLSEDRASPLHAQSKTSQRRSSHSWTSHRTSQYQPPRLIGTPARLRPRSQGDFGSPEPPRKAGAAHIATDGALTQFRVRRGMPAGLAVAYESPSPLTAAFAPHRQGIPDVCV